MDISHLRQALSGLLGEHCTLRPLGRSSFCDTWQASQGRRMLFVKSAPSTGASMLRAEADGLRALAATGCIRVPAVEALRELPDDGAMLAMQWLDFVPPDAGFGQRFGRALAALHAHPCPLEPSSFGWRSDNFLGATPQRNTPVQPATQAGWLVFVAQARLGWMRERLPAEATELRAAAQAVIQRLPELFAEGHAPRPALIHGDLWHGNWGMLDDGTPVVFDPAVSCSDPEAELGMMELFGGVPPGFRTAYRQAGGNWPPPQRLQLYQLYHLLNHVVLFGSGYASQALRLARALG